MTDTALSSATLILTEQEEQILHERFHNTGHVALPVPRDNILLPTRESTVRPLPSLRLQRVLSIWPSPIYDAQEEMETVFDNAKLDYVPLYERMATFEGVVWEIRRARYDIVDVVAHGTEAGIQLHDGLATPGWWRGMAEDNDVALWVLMASESSWPGGLNIADALIAGGAQAVISVDSQITDEEVIAIRRWIYLLINGTMSLDQIVRIARQIFPPTKRTTIRLRER